MCIVQRFHPYSNSFSNNKHDSLMQPTLLPWQHLLFMIISRASLLAACDVQPGETNTSNTRGHPVPSFSQHNIKLSGCSACHGKYMHCIFTFVHKRYPHQSVLACPPWPNARSSAPTVCAFPCASVLDR